MSKRVHIDLIPKTPGGRHIKLDELFAEQIEVDDDITIKASLLRECVPGNPWFEGEGDPEEVDHTQKPKYLVRKSVDLRRIRSLKDRVEAIRASPMVDARPRRSRSQSFSEGSMTRSADEDAPTPLRLPSRSDLLHTTSRRLSRIVMNRRSVLFSPGAHPTTTAEEAGSAIEPLQMNENSDMSAIGLQTPLIRRKSVLTSPAASTISEKAAPLMSLAAPLATSGASSSDEKPATAASVAMLEDPSSIADFRLLAEVEQSRLNILCNDWRSVMSEEADKIPEQALDAIRATVGKCKLVLDKKIPFFLSLVDLADSSSAPQDLSESKENKPPSTTANDLAGYWALVANEITRADEAFERLRVWRDEGQWDATTRPVTPARHGPIDKRTRPTVPKRSKIPTKQIPVGRKVDLSSLPSGTPKALAQALKKAEKKSKTPMRSKFAEFLKSKKAVMKSERVVPASPLVIFETAAPQVSSNITSELVTSIVPTRAIETSTTTTANGASTLAMETEVPQTPSLETGAIKHDDSFVVPKQRMPASSTRHAGRSAVKRAAPPPPLRASDASSTSVATHLDTSTEDRSLLPSSTGSNSNSSQLHVASTPITSVRAVDSWQFESSLKTPTSALRGLQLSGKSYASLSSIRPGTPRPPMKPKSSKKQNQSSTSRAALHSGKSLTTSTIAESLYVTPPPLGDEHASVTPGMSQATDHYGSQPQTAHDRKRISFAPELSHTPGGHRFGSGSPRQSYPLTPANVSGSLFAADRVLRRRRNIVDALTPLGLRPVSRRSRGTPKPHLN